jgi:hypothetical protein
MQTLIGVDLCTHKFLTALDDVNGNLDGSIASPRETAPFTHWKGGWVRKSVGLNAVQKKDISFPYRESNTDPLCVLSAA